MLETGAPLARLPLGLVGVSSARKSKRYSDNQASLQVGARPDMRVGCGTYASFGLWAPPGDSLRNCLPPGLPSFRAASHRDGALAFPCTVPSVGAPSVCAAVARARESFTPLSQNTASTKCV